MAKPSSKAALQALVSVVINKGVAVTSEWSVAAGDCPCPVAFNPYGELFIWDREVEAESGRWILAEFCLKTHRIIVWGSNDEENRNFLWKGVLDSYSDDLYSKGRAMYKNQTSRE